MYYRHADSSWMGDERTNQRLTHYQIKHMSSTPSSAPCRKYSGFLHESLVIAEWPYANGTTPNCSEFFGVNRCNSLHCNLLHARQQLCAPRRVKQHVSGSKRVPRCDTYISCS